MEDEKRTARRKKKEQNSSKKSRKVVSTAKRRYDPEREGTSRTNSRSTGGQDSTVLENTKYKEEN